MKTTACLATLSLMLAAGLMTTPGQAAPTGEYEPASESKTSGRYPAERLGLMQRASKLMGATVRDREDRKLGKIKDVVMDCNSGRIYCALVAPAGLYGANDYVVALPAAGFVSVDPKTAVFDATNFNLVDAPRFKAGNWNQETIAKSVTDSYQRFHQVTTWDAKAGPGQFGRCSDLLGKEVCNQAGVNVGKVAELMLDLPAGRTIYTVVSFYGGDGNQHAMPPGVLKVDPAKKTLTLTVDEAKVASFAYHDAFLWTDMIDPTWAAATYRAYGKEPDFSTAPGARAKTPVASDSDLRQNIVTAMIQDDIHNASVAKKIKISIVSGKVTLSGRVKTEQERDNLGSIAESVAGAGNVDNQLAAQ